MSASPSFGVGRVQHENAPSGVGLRRDPLRDFLRLDHASEEAIPNTATTTPIRPMIASVDIRPLRLSEPIVDFWCIVSFFEDVGIAEMETKKAIDAVKDRRRQCKSMRARDGEQTDLTDQKSELQSSEHGGSL